MTETPMGVQDQRNVIIARVYREWAAEHADVQPDEEYLKPDGEDSQYAEGITALSAGKEADDDLDARIDAALAEAGIPFPTV